MGELAGVAWVLDAVYADGPEADRDDLEPIQIVRDTSHGKSTYGGTTQGKVEIEVREPSRSSSRITISTP